MNPSISLSVFLFASISFAAPPALVTTLSLGPGGIASAIAANPVTNVVYLIDFGHGTAVELDGSTNGTLATVPLPPKTVLYVAVNKTRNQFVATGANGEVFDGATNTPLVSITTNQAQVGNDPYTDTVINDVTNNVYSTTLSSILKTDLATGAVTLLANPSFKPGDICTVHGMAVNTALNWVYAAVQCSVASGGLFVFDGTTGATVQAVDLGGSLPTGANIGEVVFNPQSNKLYIANYGGFAVLTQTPVPPSVEVYNGTTIGHLASVPNVVGPLAVDDSLNAIYGMASVCCSGALIDGSTDNLNSTFPLGFSVSGLNAIPIAANEATHMVYYANEFAGTVSVFQGSLPSPGAFSVNGKLSGSAIAGITLTAQGGSTFTAVTDATGAYTLSGMPPGAYTVTPTSAGLFFSPSSQVVNIATANVAGINFADISTPIAVTSLTLSPYTTIASGVTTNGTITLNQPAPAGGIVVTLISGNKVIKLPASVAVSAGSSSATFSVQASGVNVATPVTITATYSGPLAAGPSSASAVVTVSPTDTLHIQSATWSRSTQILKVAATSTNPQAVLTLFLASGNVNLGTFSNLGRGNFSYQAPFNSGTPASVNVKSNLNGATGQGVTVIP